MNPERSSGVVDFVAGARGRALVLSCLALLIVSGCGGARAAREVPPETARQELALRGIPFKEKNFVQSATHGDEWAVRLFLAAGMSPGVKDEAGQTPLLAAVNAEQYKLVRLMLAKKPDVNKRD